MNKSLKYGVGIIIIVLVVFMIIGFSNSNNENTISLLPAEAGISLEYDSLYDSDGEDLVNEKIDLLKESLDGSPDDYNRYIDIALQEDLIGNGNEVLANLNEAIKINPENTLAYNNIGTLFEKVGAYESAKNTFAKALEIDDSVVYTHQLIIDLHKSYLNSSDEVMEDVFDTALGKTNRDLQILRDYASWLTREDKYQEALVIWNELLNKETGDKSLIQNEIDIIESRI